MRSNLAFLALLFGVLTHCNIYAQLNLDPAAISLQVVDLKTGKTMMERNGSQCAIPASITKVISTATALEILGPDFTYKTTIEHDGTITDGVLYGNLYIRGGGDPTLGSKKQRV